MRRAFHTETTIARPPDEVWAESRGKTRRSRISALEPGRSITLDSVQGGVTARYVDRFDRGQLEDLRAAIQRRPANGARP